MFVFNIWRRIFFTAHAQEKTRRFCVYIIKETLLWLTYGILGEGKRERKENKQIVPEIFPHSAQGKQIKNDR